jgi:hypothetical protein
LPHEIGQLNQKDFLWIHQLQIIEPALGCQHMKRIQCNELYTLQTQGFRIQRQVFPIGRRQILFLMRTFSSVGSA